MLSIRRIKIAAAVLALPVVVGCVHHSRADQGSRSVKPIITREDIERVHANSALDAVQRFRGDVLISKSAPSSILLNKHLFPVVFMNDQYYGAIDELRNVPSAEIEEIRILN